MYVYKFICALSNLHLPLGSIVLTFVKKTMTCFHTAILFYTLHKKIYLHLFASVIISNQQQIIRLSK